MSIMQVPSTSGANSRVSFHSNSQRKVSHQDSRITGNTRHGYLNIVTGYTSKYVFFALSFSASIIFSVSFSSFPAFIQLQPLVSQLTWNLLLNQPS